MSLNSPKLKTKKKRGCNSNNVRQFWYSPNSQENTFGYELSILLEYGQYNLHIITLNSLVAMSL